MADISKKKKHPGLRQAKRRIEALNFLSNISLDGSAAQLQEKARGDDSKTGEVNLFDTGAKHAENARRDEGSVSATTVSSIGPAAALGHARSLVDTPSGSIQCSAGNRVRTRSRRVSGEKSPPVASQRYDPSFFHSRMLLVTPNHSPFVVFSLLPYTRRSQLGIYRCNSEAGAFARTRRLSGSKPLRVQSEDFLATLDGVELGEEGTVMSFSHFLVPTRDLSLLLYRKHLQDLEQLSAASPHSPAIRKMTLSSVSPLQWEKGEFDGHAVDHAALTQRIYDPMALDDPELSLGKHRKLLTFSSYMVSLVDYTKPSELKKDLNNKFKERFPDIELTLSKLRSLKQEMKKVALDLCSLDPWILALAYIYYEKLVLNRKINKDNRKSCAGTCLLLAAKLSDVKGPDLQTLFKETESTFRESRKTLIAFEFPILVALEFSLHVPEHEVIPQLKRILQQS